MIWRDRVKDITLRENLNVKPAEFNGIEVKNKK